MSPQRPDLNNRKTRRFVGTHPGIIAERSNAWPAPDVIIVLAVLQLWMMGRARS